MPTLTNDEMLDLQKSGHGRAPHRPLPCPRCGRPAETPRLPALTRCDACQAEFGYCIEAADGTAAVPTCPTCRLAHLLPAVMSKDDAEKRRIMDLVESRKRYPPTAMFHPAVWWVHVKCGGCEARHFVCITAPPAIETPPAYRPRQPVGADPPPATPRPSPARAGTAGEPRRSQWWRFWA